MVGNAAAIAGSKAATSSLLWFARALFVTQRVHRINARGAGRGQITGDDSDDADEETDFEIRRRAGSVDSEKQIGKRAAQGESARNPDDGAERNEAKAFAKN